MIKKKHILNILKPFCQQDVSTHQMAPIDTFALGDVDYLFV